MFPSQMPVAPSLFNTVVLLELKESERDLAIQFKPALQARTAPREPVD